MTQETSRLVYEEIKYNGVLTKLRLKVFKFVCGNGPCSQLDAQNYFKDHKQNSIQNRFSELVNFKLLKIVGQVRKDGAIRNTYDITERTKIEKPSFNEKVILLNKLKLKRLKINDKIKKLENEINLETKKSLGQQTELQLN